MLPFPLRLYNCFNIFVQPHVHTVSVLWSTLHSRGDGSDIAYSAGRTEMLGILSLGQILRPCLPVHPSSLDPASISHPWHVVLPPAAMERLSRRVVPAAVPWVEEVQLQPAQPHNQRGPCRRVAGSNWAARPIGGPDVFLRFKRHGLDDPELWMKTVRIFIRPSVRPNKYEHLSG